MRSRDADGDRSDLAALEDRIRSGANQCWLAFSEICERRLYRLAGFSTFEQYCSDTWGLTPQRVRQLAEAGSVVRELPEAATMTERAVREVAKVPRERRAEVLERASAESGGRPPSAAQVRRHAERALEERSASNDAPPEFPPERVRRGIEEFRQLLRCVSTLRNQVKAARESGHAPHLTQSIDATIASIAGAFRESKPHAVCPHCAGQGCDRCAGRGWICKVELVSMSARLRSMATLL
jgi:hypothetical protein